MYTLDTDRDDGISCNLHGAELRVAGTQERLRIPVFLALAQYFGAPAQHHPPEPRPVLLVAIHDDRDRRVLGDVPQPLKRGDRAPLRFFVNGDVERVVRNRKADRHDVRDCMPVGGRKMRHQAHNLARRRR